VLVLVVVVLGICAIGRMYRLVLWGKDSATGSTIIVGGVTADCSSHNRTKRTVESDSPSHFSNATLQSEEIY
jgi:hypothetical protein